MVRSSAAELRTEAENRIRLPSPTFAISGHKGNSLIEPLRRNCLIWTYASTVSWRSSLWCNRGYSVSYRSPEAIRSWLRQSFMGWGGIKSIYNELIPCQHLTFGCPSGLPPSHHPVWGFLQLLYRFNRNREEDGENGNSLFSVYISIFISIFILISIYI
jgi:hypothetical protein